MDNKFFSLSRFLLIPIDRCNLRCKLCSENIPLNRPDPDMTVKEAKKILTAFFDIVDKVKVMHISGGGEPFLHKDLDLLIEECMVFRKQFDSFLMFTNGTIIPSDRTLKVLGKYKDIISVRVSDYGIYTEMRNRLYEKFADYGINYRKIIYNGDNQDYNGWLDYGDIAPLNRTDEELTEIFHGCASLRYLQGNWRSRNGEVHFCSRAARGAQLGLIPKNDKDFVDLFDENLTKQQKRQKFINILSADYITACDYCSGDYGTDDKSKRFPAAEQME